MFLPSFRSLLSPLLFLDLILSLPVIGQDLDPRAYMRTPVKSTTLITGLVYSQGGVVTDPTLPIQNIKAKVEAGSLGMAHTFNLLGLTAQALVALPYSWAQVSGAVGGLDSAISRSGLADMRMRLSVLLLGGKAADVATLRKAPRKTIVGASLNVVAPTGQFFPDKLINLGTNRWAFRPELAVSQPIGRRWLADLYGGIWLFTNNKTFYPGNSLRKQEPMGAFQLHVSYNIRPVLWVALNATYYTGGTSSVNNQYKDDRQANARVGITAVVPTGKMSALRFSASTGAIVRIGQDFTSYSLGWQKSWIAGFNPGKK